MILTPQSVMRIMFIKPLACEWSINVNHDYITNQTVSTFLVQATITSFWNDCSGFLTGVPACMLAQNLFTTQHSEESFLNINQVLSLPHSKPYAGFPSHFEQSPKSLLWPTGPCAIWPWPISLISLNDFLYPYLPSSHNFLVVPQLCRRVLAQGLFIC